MERIDIKPTDTLNEKFLSVKDYHIELHGLFLRKIMRCVADVTKVWDDPLSGYEEVECVRDIVCLRSRFSGIEKVRTTDKKFKVQISFDGVADEVNCFFRSETSADAFLDKVLLWGLGLDKAQTHALPY